MKRKWIWLDMDGTITDLYSVNNWLEDLRAFRTRPYEKALSKYNDIDVLSILACLKGEGYNIGVISWGSKEYDDAYLKRIELAKIEWLKNRGYDMVLDKILVVPYGTNKAEVCKVYGNGVLVDDENRNLDAWNLGKTINAQFDILSQLEALL